MAGLALLASLPLAGCGSSKVSPSATVPRPTTSTTISVATVPDVITVAYAQAVMDELDKVLGDAIRELVASKGPSNAFVARLKAVYAEPQYSEAIESFGIDAAAEFPHYARDPGNPETQIASVVDSSKRCLVAVGERTFAPAITTEQRGRSVLQLQLKADRDPGHLNPTAWVIVADRTGDANIPENPCR